MAEVSKLHGVESQQYYHYLNETREVLQNLYDSLRDHTMWNKVSWYTEAFSIAIVQNIIR